MYIKILSSRQAMKSIFICGRGGGSGVRFDPNLTVLRSVVFLYVHWTSCLNGKKIANRFVNKQHLLSQCGKWGQHRTVVGGATLEIIGYNIRRWLNLTLEGEGVQC